MNTDDLETQAVAAYGRVRGRVETACAENRDLTPDEIRACDADRAIMERLRVAEQREQDEQHHATAALIGKAMETATRSRNNLSPLFPSAENLRLLEEARRRMSTMSVIENRAALKTTDMGTATEYGPSGLLAPRTLWRASGIPTSQPAAGYAAVVPQFTLPAGTTLVSEGNAHAEFDDVAPDSVQLRRTGAWSDLTAEGLISTSLTEITNAHARILARDLDLALVDKLEGSDSSLDIDEALVTVAAECACDVSDLWIVGDPTSVADLVGVASAMTPTSAGDVASFQLRYASAAVYPTPAATALTVFHPQSFRVFATNLASAVTTDPSTGVQRFGQWQLWGVGQTLVGAALTVGGSGSGS